MFFNAPPPTTDYAGGLFDGVIAIQPGTTSGTSRETRPRRLDQRFVISWPSKLRVDSRESVVVKIASDDYERLLEGLEIGRKNTEGISRA